MNSYGSLRLGCFQFLFGIFLCLNQLHSYYALALTKEICSKIILKSSQYNL